MNGAASSPLVPAGAELALAQPGWLWLLPLVALAAWWAWRRAPRARFAAAPLLGGAANDAAPAALPRTWRVRLRALPAVLELLGAALLVVALAAPVQRVPVPPTPPGRDILLCLDVSSSMAADDLRPGRTRLEVGVELATAFVRARSHDRIGCVAFARFADLRCPATSDHGALAETLAALRLVAKDGPEDATAIGAAVGLAATALQRAAAGTKVIVVVTDGEENVATALTPDEIAPLHAAQLCAAAGIRVHGVVVGRGNRKPDGRFVALDTTAVEQLATTTGGRFFAAADAAAFAQVYAAIDALEANAAQPPGVLERPRFALVLAAATVLLAVARALRGTWLRSLP